MTPAENKDTMSACLEVALSLCKKKGLSTSAAVARIAVALFEDCQKETNAERKARWQRND